MNLQKITETWESDDGGYFEADIIFNPDYEYEGAFLGRYIRSPEDIHTRQLVGQVEQYSTIEDARTSAEEYLTLSIGDTEI